MAISIGMICEGSHDFNVLSQFVTAIVRAAGLHVSRLDCLQPLVSATFQTSGGGWTQVKSWCESEGGTGYRRHIDRPIFATSVLYDLLIVHVDGDVAALCNSDQLKSIDLDTSSISSIEQALKAVVVSEWLSPKDEHLKRIVTCIPVRHLEAWLAAGTLATIHSPEGRDMKVEFRKSPPARGKASWRKKYIRCAAQSVQNLDRVREACHSYRVFEGDLAIAAGSVGS